MQNSGAVSTATRLAPLLFRRQERGVTVTEMASGLRFPEGPIALPDGSVLVVEMFGPCLTRVYPDGSRETVVEIPGGPNGAALGPDGTVYVCNNGGCYAETVVDGLTIPHGLGLDGYMGGKIQRVDLEDGTVTDLYTACDGNALRGPNDIVFDGLGGFYFTDSGVEDGRVLRHGAIYYAQEDGSAITELCFPAEHPNGIGLSPDGSILYWAETWTGRLQQRRVLGPGVLAEVGFLDESACLHGFPGYQLLDSLAVDAEGNVCVATDPIGGISVVAPDGSLVEFVSTPDMVTTNICFGGPDMRTAYITLSSTGRLIRMPWPRAGLRLHHQEPAVTADAR
jgi:gluconolactonase